MIILYKSIIIAVDDSKNARRAVKEVINFNTTNIHVTLVHVKDAIATRDSLLHKRDAISEKQEALNWLQLSLDFLEDNDIRYEVKLLHGLIEETLLDEINNGSYDVVLIGRTGKNIIKDFIVGSVGKRIIKASNIPVLVVN